MGLALARRPTVVVFTVVVVRDDSGGHPLGHVGRCAMISIATVRMADITGLSVVARKAIPETPADSMVDPRHCRFRHEYESFRKLHASVVGVSSASFFVRRHFSHYEKDVSSFPIVFAISLSSQRTCSCTLRLIP